MDIRKVKKIHEGEESVRISRGSSPSATAPQTYVSAPLSPSTAARSETIKSHLNADDTKSLDDYSDEGHVINAPMVGIFYNSPSPEEPPFVDKNQQIKVGDTLCIIEAMKIMNHIESDVSGKLLRSLVENGEAVEYGQPLFIIDPS